MFFLSIMAMLLAKDRLLGKIPSLLEYLQYLGRLALGLRIGILNDFGLQLLLHTMYRTQFHYRYIYYQLRMIAF